MATTTYATNADLSFDNGRSIDNLLDVDLSDAQMKTLKDETRERIYNHININIGRTDRIKL